MKANQLIRIVILLLYCMDTFQLPAQQDKADNKELADLRTKSEKGDADAAVDLSNFYLIGDKVKRDFQESAKWAKKAAETGDVRGCVALASLYGEGLGVEKNPVEAAKWWRKAAEQGDEDAEYNLARCYEDGRGVDQNYTEALKWYRLGIEKNDHPFPGVSTGLGRMYRLGHGVPKNYAQALQYLFPAAEGGWLAAQYELGLMYAHGEGVTEDYVEAYKWFNLAATDGGNAALSERDAMAKKMTSAQIVKAQALTREFKPEKKADTTTQPTGSGSGFFITEDGFLITNEHVVEDATQIRLIIGAGLISARVIKVDAANDLALLKADGKFTPLPITSSRTAHLGNTVATVGFPNTGMQGFAPKFAKGEIAALSGAQDDARYFQISVPVQPGNSGGALVDEHGNVVGVVSAKLNAAAALAASGALPENVNYAVKSGFLLSFLESVPEVSAKLAEPNSKERKFEDVVKSAEQAAVLVLVY